MFIKKILARKILDSRKEPTIEVEINGRAASSPSGKSTGKYETPSFYKSLEWNIAAINNFTDLESVEIKNFSHLEKIEKLIEKKFKLKDAKQFGANALFALESAVLKALAHVQKKELWEILNSKAKKIPVPVGNAVGGGLHSHNKNKPVFQEFLIIPQGNSAKENFKILKKIYGKLRKNISATGKNDEGAWQTSLNDEKILETLSKNKNAKVGVDAAASSFYSGRSYVYKNKSLDRKTQIDYINSLIKYYKIFYCEDPLQEEDFSGFAKISSSKKNLIVGDDLTATHISRLKKAIKLKAINAMIIKPNQNGSLLELAEIFKICKHNKIKTVISHRSGETLDDALADLAFGFGADFIKCGISTKWREVKLKRMCEIEKQIKARD